MGASRGETDFALAVVVAVLADYAACHVHNGQRGFTVRDSAGAARRSGERDLFLRVDLRASRRCAERFRRPGGNSYFGKEHAAGDGENESGQRYEYGLQLDDWRRACFAYVPEERR